MSQQSVLSHARLLVPDKSGQCSTSWLIQNVLSNEIFQNYKKDLKM